MIGEVKRYIDEERGSYKDELGSCVEQLLEVMNVVWMLLTNHDAAVTLNFHMVDWRNK